MTDSKEILILTAISLYIIGYIVDHILCIIVAFVYMKGELQYIFSDNNYNYYMLHIYKLFFGI